MMTFARDVSTRTIFMDGGDIVSRHPAELFSAPQQPRTRAFSTTCCDPLPMGAPCRFSAFFRVDCSSLPQRSRLTAKPCDLRQCCVRRTLPAFRAAAQQFHT